MVQEDGSLLPIDTSIMSEDQPNGPIVSQSIIQDKDVIKNVNVRRRQVMTPGFVPFSRPTKQARRETLEESVVCFPVLVLSHFSYLHFMILVGISSEVSFFCRSHWTSTHSSKQLAVEEK